MCRYCFIKEKAIMKQILTILLLTGALQANDLVKGMDALEVGNFEKAIEFFKKSAESGNKMAQHNLSVMYNNGYGVEKDDKIVAYWINEALN